MELANVTSERKGDKRRQEMIFYRTLFGWQRRVGRTRRNRLGPDLRIFRAAC